MKYLIYLMQYYEDVEVTSVEVKEVDIDFALKVIDDLGMNLGIMDTPSKDSKKLKFNTYCNRKLKDTIKKLKEFEKKYKSLQKKTQKDLDNEYEKRKQAEEGFVKSLGSNVTVSLPFNFPINLTQEKSSIKREINKLTKLLDIFNE